jgi:hypothetical protein
MAILAANRFTGYAVLDTSGIVPGGFGSWNLRPWKDSAQRVRILREKVFGALLRLRPEFVVVGTARRYGSATAELRQAICEVMAESRIPVVHRSASESRQLFLGYSGETTVDAIAKVMVRAFFSQLVASKISDASGARYRRNAFSALALALHELAIRSPLAAAVISKDEAFEIRAWKTLLAEQAQRLYPQENL